MTYGLLVNNASGQSVLDPDSFTVRMVASTLVNAGQMSWNATLDVAMPGVTVGMQVILSPLIQYPVAQNLDNEGSWPAFPEPDQSPALPIPTAYNGFVRLSAVGARNYANVAIYVFTYT